MARLIESFNLRVISRQRAVNPGLITDLILIESRCILVWNHQSILVFSIF